MSDTVKCPICGTERELEPHPENAERQVAYCDCRGTKVMIVDQPATSKAYRPSKASKGDE